MEGHVQWNTRLRDVCSFWRGLGLGLNALNTCRMCKGVAVMRRRADSWLNATQILKVAGFDKPQRTRVLEREVQKGEHEKVQGGYGKYQGITIREYRFRALSANSWTRNVDSSRPWC